MPRPAPIVNPKPIRYIHLRYKNEDGVLINNMGVTIAYRETKDNQDKVELAYARCSYEDNFCKKVGRDITTGWLNYGHSHIIIKPTDGITSLFDAVVNYTVEQVNKLAVAHEQED